MTRAPNETNADLLIKYKNLITQLRNEGKSEEEIKMRISKMKGFPRGLDLNQANLKP